MLTTSSTSSSESSTGNGNLSPSTLPSKFHGGSTNPSVPTIPKTFDTITSYIKYLERESSILFPLPCGCQEEKERKVIAFSENSLEHEIEKYFYETNRKSHAKIWKTASFEEEKKGVIPPVLRNEKQSIYGLYGDCHWCKTTRWFLSYLVYQFNSHYKNEKSTKEKPVVSVTNGVKSNKGGQQESVWKIEEIHL